MRIAIDMRLASSYPSSGLGMFEKHAWTPLHKYVPENTYISLYEREGEFVRRGGLNQWVGPIYVDYVHKQLALPAKLQSLGVDLLFCPIIPVPVWAPCATVLMVHGGTTHLKMFRKTVGGRLRVPRVLWYHVALPEIILT